MHPLPVACASPRARSLSLSFRFHFMLLSLGPLFSLLALLGVVCLPQHIDPVNPSGSSLVFSLPVGPVEPAPPRVGVGGCCTLIGSSFTASLICTVVRGGMEGGEEGAWGCVWTFVD